MDGRVTGLERSKTILRTRRHGSVVSNSFLPQTERRKSASLLSSPPTSDLSNVKSSSRLSVSGSFTMNWRVTLGIRTFDKGLVGFSLIYVPEMGSVEG